MRFDIGIDLDGVLYDFGGAFIREVIRAGYDVPLLEKDQIKTWDFYREWGWTDAQFVEAAKAAVNDGHLFWRGRPWDDGDIELTRLRREGHRIHVITARLFGNEKWCRWATNAWLASWNIETNSVTLSNDKTVVKTDFFLEDKIENYDSLEAAGTKSFLINRPWNQMNDNRRRVNSVREFVDRIIDLRILVD